MRLRRRNAHIISQLKETLNLRGWKSPVELSYCLPITELLGLNIESVEIIGDISDASQHDRPESAVDEGPARPGDGIRRINRQDSDQQYTLHAHWDEEVESGVNSDVLDGSRSPRGSSGLEYEFRMVKISMIYESYSLGYILIHRRG